MNKVLIYCANGYGERVAYSLSDDYDVVGFVDGDPGTWGWSLAGKKVIPPSEIGKVFHDIMIIAVSEFADKIKHELISQYKEDEKKIIVFEPSDMIQWQEERIVELRKCISIIKERGLEGSLAELGVYKGDFSYVMNKFLPDRKLYLFDTFEGFAAEKDRVENGDVKLFKDTSVDVVLNRMYNIDNCIIRKGYFPDTAQNLEENFVLVSIDCDLYEPMLAGLNYFYPRLVKGGYIFIHDFGTYHWTGVKKAVYEFCEKKDIGFFPLVDRCLSVVITK